MCQNAPQKRLWVAPGPPRPATGCAGQAAKNVSCENKGRSRRPGRQKCFPQESPWVATARELQMSLSKAVMSCAGLATKREDAEPYPCIRQSVLAGGHRTTPGCARK
eukprot:TRINITY_DN27677_c0_g1_i1.p1 TRINITY_DN27677_c0_g1~~TRINITY_DN27677_c0_g1_i1.p1  ORF type:complete len:107 (+),score=2.39 TRINITY_DN27677_c0_g1_i1:52-372(+)